MALVALSRQNVTLVGWTDPRPYDSGTFKADDGSTVDFPAGVSFKVCVASGEHDYTEMKVKTAEVNAVHQALQGLKRGDQVVVSFEKNSGNFRLFEIAGAGK